MSSNTDTSAFLIWNQADTLEIKGNWVLAHASALETMVAELAQKIAAASELTIHVQALQHLDTTGAYYLSQLLGTENTRRLAQESTLEPGKQALLSHVAQTIQDKPDGPATKPPLAILTFLADIGQGLSDFAQQAVQLAGFIGMTLQALLASLVQPRRWRFTSLVAQIHQTGLNALPIVALLTFLVGAVVAFLGATILQDFGATRYTINLVGFSFLREFAVLLAAILMAGRTASSFAAQIGSMNINEEIDALKVLQLNPLDMLVLPRVLAMLISLPVLTFVGMIAGIGGGMLVCMVSLDISPRVFLDVFSNSIPLRHFIIGMAKAPIFAFLIAVIGCLQGFQVSGSAQSLGERTTAAVVHSIFMVILLDAIAALFFMEMGW